MSLGPEHTARLHTWVKLVVDVAVWTAAAGMAFLLRLSDPFAADLLRKMIEYALLGVALKAGLVWGFRLHRQAWYQVTIRDLVSMAVAVAAGTGILFSVGIFWFLLEGFPRTVPLIEGLLALLGMGGIRLFRRVLKERRTHSLTVASSGRRRILLVGAGEAGGRIAREMRRHPGVGLHPVGYVDDDPAKMNLRIGGLPVLGRIEDLPRVAVEHTVDEILIAIPSASGRETRRIVDLARQLGVRFRILPGVAEILTGDVSLSRIREVQVQDLLRREPIHLDVQGMASYLEGRVVLVTGAGGSIGSEIVRQVALFGPRRIVLLGRGENSLHRFEQELRRDLPELDHQRVVGNVCDVRKMDEVFATYKPAIVFHAAAHKHVPMMEFDPDEAVLNNVGGTRNIARAALSAGVERFVNISSDKAVNPVSMVGITKMIAEQVVRRTAQDAGAEQAFVSVRFGNVLGSRGSVVPVFQEQIRRGGPITITDPEMRRYFMTIPEASQLVIQAAASGQNGAVYVLDMGTEVRIFDLARDMIRLSGAREEDIDIEFTGLRPGEKLREELFTEEEQLGATRYEQILVSRSETPLTEGFLPTIDELLAAAQRRDWDGMDRGLRDLVPGLQGKAAEWSEVRRAII